jgi:peptide/nickel transport system substrate-binding protein
MTHPHIPTLYSDLERGRIDRREFLRTATLLGMGAVAAYAAAGLPAPAMAQTALPKGGRVRVAMRVHEVKDSMTVAWVEASNLARQTNDFLVRTEQDNVTRPLLIKQWDASPDLKTWTLHIDPAAKWRSGRPFLADDAIWNIKRALNPKTGSSILGLMKSYLLTETPTGETKDGKPVMTSALWDANAIERVDERTLRLNLKTAQLAVPEHLFHYPFSMLDPEQNGMFGVGMNGTGPFEMTAYEPGRRAVMKGRKDYWRGAPNLDSLEFIDLGSDSGALIAALASKQVDGLYEVDIAQLDAIKALPHIALYPVGTAQTGVARGRVTEKPFDDKRVRMALKLAIDTQKVADIVFRGNAEPAEHTHVAPVYPDYHAMPPMKQDIPRARALLAEAGHPNGIDVEIACKNQPAWESAVTTVMAEMWKEAGIRVKINVMPASAYWDVWMKIPFGFTTWTHRPLAVMTLGLAYRTGGGFNESGYSNPEFDRLLTEAEGTLDVDKRREIMGKLQTIMQEDGPIVQPIWRKVQTGYDKKVKGFRMHPSQYIFGEQLAVEA